MRLVVLLTASLIVTPAAPSLGSADAIDYLLLATKKTSTLEQEMSEAAASGYRLAFMMGGATAFGGDEIVAVMSREAGGGASEPRYEYALLATNKTSTMQKEMSAMAREGYVHRAQSVAGTSFGGLEVIVIMEREATGEPGPRAEYLLLATNKTSTMQKELREAGQAGYAIVGMTVARTTFGGEETVAILERPVE